MIKKIILFLALSFLLTGDALAQTSTKESPDVTVTKSVPYIQLNKWDREVSLGIIPSDAVSYSASNSTGATTTWGGSNKSMKAYQTGNDFEIDINLDSIPSSNVFSFQFDNYADMAFLYQGNLYDEPQPPETDHCTAMECFNKAGKVIGSRPENVVGSYAVYSKSKINNKYTTGKLFHIYRPKIIDNNGAWVWGVLTYSEGVLTVTVPQTFLDGATYPVRVDPTFGYTTIGGTSQSVGAAEINVTQYTSNAEIGTITSITSYVGQSGSGAGSVGAGIYSDSADTPVTQLALDTGDGAVPASPDWVTQNISYTVAASTKYWLGNFLQTTGNAYYYDAGATLHGFLDVAFESWPSPWSGGNFSLPRTLSIYVTYTTSAVGQTAYRFRNDNGSETTATWIAAENTAITAPNMTNTRVRGQASTTGDLASTAFQLEFKLSTDATYKRVGTTTTAISFLSTTTAVVGKNSVATTNPYNLNVGDLLIMSISNKNAGVLPTTPSGWTLIANARVVGGQGAAGTDTGTTTTTVYYKESDGTESGTQSVTITSGNCAVAGMAAYRRGSGQHWVLAAVGASQNTGNSVSWSAASTTVIGIIASDIIYASSGVNGDAATFTAEAMAATGVTFGATTEVYDANTTTGNDCALIVSQHLVTSGTDSSGPTYTMTASASGASRPAGGTVMLRLRQVDDDIQLNPSANITDTGDPTTAQLSVPGGKSFTAGNINDIRNPGASVDIASDGYSEFEQNVIATTTAINGNIYQFRWTKNGIAFSAYNVTPTWTIGATPVVASTPTIRALYSSPLRYYSPLMLY